MQEQLEQIQHKCWKQPYGCALLSLLKYSYNTTDMEICF